MCIMQFPKTNFLDYLKQVLLSDAFENFILCRVFDKVLFCIGEKQGMIVNNGCSSWYNRIDTFDVSLGVGLR